WQPARRPTHLLTNFITLLPFSSILLLADEFFVFKIGFGSVLSLFFRRGRSNSFC
ncbi:unnamed protein product, partial [Brassica rapa subsp. trilocularis]